MYALGVFYGGLCFAYLIESNNRLWSFFQWAKNYVTRRCAARQIDD